MQYADLHHHVIYGVDDGPQSFEDAQAMLRSAHENGITAIAATSHATPGRHRFPMDTYLAHLQKEQEWADQQGLGIKLYTGCEILYTDETARLLQSGEIPTINGSRLILVEFLPANDFQHIKNAVRRLGNAGYTVVVAHAERYDGTRKVEDLLTLREDLGAYIQINARTFISPGGFFAKRWLRKVMENGCCDLAATDAHNTSSRPCQMKKCHETIAKEWGRDVADRLCVETPRQLLELE